jgi:cell division protein FtsB
LSAVPTQRASGPARSADDGGSGSGTRPPLKRRTRYTARAAVLLLVFCALVLALAYPLQQYFSQRSQLGKLKQQNSAKRAEVDQLRKELERWQDPDYVRIQARSRLHYVLPGETGLRLLGSGDAASGAQNPASTQGGGTAAWYSQLWGSVTSAAAAPATPPSPSQSPTSPTSPRSATTSTPSPTPATSPTPSTTPSSTKH